MAQEKENNDKAFSPQQIDELTVIYDNYLYFVRQYERMLAEKQKLALYQFDNILYQDKNPYPDKENEYFPWDIELLSYYEAKHFDDFLDEKIHHKTGRAYISFQHTNPAEDKNKPLTFVPRDYTVNMMDMPLPSSIERYVIVAPENAKICNTEFYVDGFYKATYTRTNKQDQTVFDCLKDPNVRAEFRILINFIDNMRKHHYEDIREDVSRTWDIYAAETTSPYEKDILEMIGSFAEKLQSLCRQKYNIQSGKRALLEAQKEGLIDSAEDFRDYVNIRNLIRHQWDTMDELGHFSARKADKNSSKRAEMVQSYLKLCDKTLMQRMKSYIAVLQQMRQLICQLNPERIVREKSETNRHFAKRIKEIYRQNPNKPITVELNYPQESDKYKSLNHNLHKIVPQIRILDDFSAQQGELTQMENDYRLRTWYLQSYHAMECQMMHYCITRGLDVDNHGAWKYMKTKGIISEQKENKWQSYTNLRNALSHNCLSEELRKQMHALENQYEADARVLSGKLCELAPDVEWIEKGVYEYSHPDGVVVRLDFNNRKIINVTPTSAKTEVKMQDKVELNKKTNGRTMPDKLQKETYANGIEYSLFGDKITALKLPNGVRINLEKQRINWDIDVVLHTNAEHFNVLKTAKYKLLMDKELRLDECIEKNRSQPFRRGDTILLDYRHRATLDLSGRLRDFKFKTTDGKIIQTGFKYIKNGGAEISFADGTNVLLRNNEMTVTRGDVVLNYDTRQEFAASYNGTPLTPQLNKGNNGR